MGRAGPMKSTREPGDLPERKVTALRLREGPSVVGHKSRTERTNDLTRRAAEVIFVEDGKQHRAEGLSPVRRLHPAGHRLVRPSAGDSGNRPCLTEPRAGQHTGQSRRLDCAVVLRAGLHRLRAYRAACHRADQAPQDRRRRFGRDGPGSRRGHDAGPVPQPDGRSLGSSASPPGAQWARSSPSPRGWRASFFSHFPLSPSSAQSRPRSLSMA